LALQRDRSRPAPDDFPAQLTELLAYLEDRMPPDHPFARLAALPGRPGRPEVWLLGSSPQSAIWAAELGLPYCFADFINPNGPEIVADYVRRFVDSERLSAPLVAVASSALAAETDEEAERLASSGRMAFSMMRQGRLIKVPPVEQALGFLANRPPNPAGPTRRAVIGSPHTVRTGLEEVAAEYGARELFIVTITHGHRERRRSYELIAEAMELSPAPAAAASSRG
jgi:luciferase family oxidoreductase group 1